MLTLIVALAVAQVGDPLDCPGMTTYDMNRCAAADLDTTQVRLDRYVIAARARNVDPDSAAILAAFDASQSAWKSYAESECNAVYERWKGGTIRGVMTLGCQIDLIDSRTHVIWENWLQYMDSTPPVLPEPLATPSSNSDVAAKPSD